ncbi:hypothetical protein KAR28_03120 [Candidatus Parcubacteria bacterium]|nr:hypothetical protein [Candidatus Parcubacteria bacterium]
MLSKLFGSKARVKILKLFLIHPDDKFYIRQISRDLNLQLNSVRRELENLEKFGLFVSNPAEFDQAVEAVMSREDFIKQFEEPQKSKQKARNKTSRMEKKYYQANKNFVLYEEIKALVIKSQMLYEKDFINKLNKAGHPRLLILTGFFVNDADKTIDLFLVGRLNKRKLLKLIKDLENDLGREVNFTLMSNQEFKYRRDITDVFLYDILEGKKLVVIDEMGLS